MFFCQNRNIFMRFCYIDQPSTSRTVVKPSSQFKMLHNICRTPWYLPEVPECYFCRAFRFYHETIGFCCANGQVKLAETVKCDVMWSLFIDATSEMSMEFRRRSRTYNNAFAFTSLGMEYIH